MKVRLVDITRVIRSKNAGPGELTLDIVFESKTWFERVVAAAIIDRELIARLYRQDADDVLSVIEFAPAFAIKATLRRPLASGAVGDTDIYGAQQHVPLLGLILELPGEMA